LREAEEGGVGGWVDGSGREGFVGGVSGDEGVFRTKLFLYQVKENNWSRAVLTMQLEGRLYERSGKIINNFDFLTLGKEAKERDLEGALADQIQRFLLELGQGAFLSYTTQVLCGDRAQDHGFFAGICREVEFLFECR